VSSAQWTEVTGSLSSSTVAAEATGGFDTPDGGGVACFGMHSLVVTEGAVAFFYVAPAPQTNFAPMPKGGIVTGVLRIEEGAGDGGVSPFLYIGLQGTSVADRAYMLGLAGSPPRIVLAKRALSEGLEDLIPDAPENGILLRSSATLEVGDWVHLWLEMLVRGNGDVSIIAKKNAVSDVTDPPDWEVPLGMEGPRNGAGFPGFYDDNLQIRSGSAPLLSGRAGYGAHFTDIGRRCFFDEVTVGKDNS
jgi:hypothetical protein